MNKKYFLPVILFVLIFSICCAVTSNAARKPDIISCDAQLLQGAIEVNVKWQSEYPVTGAQVTAGSKSTEIELDTYDDNIKDAYGYHGEASLMVPVDSAGFYEDYISYVVQLEDDVGRKSRRVSGKLKVSSEYSQEGDIETGIEDDEMTGEYIDDEPPVQQKKSMIDKVLGVIERHDTPPTINDIRVNRMGKKNVSFTSQAIDDKGLTSITFKVFTSDGNLVQEQELSDLGKIWNGTTQTFLLEFGKYKVVAQATDTAGNTSPEKSKGFAISTGAGSLTVSINPGAILTEGARWRAGNGAWRQSGATLSGLAVGSHNVEFKVITGWAKPANQSIAIQAGKKVSATGTYSKATGMLAVTMVPKAVVDVGAQWRVDNGAWQQSGGTFSGLAIGQHAIEFKVITGWSRPANQNVAIRAGKTASASGTYSKAAGMLAVTMVPQAVVDAGAQWRMGNGAWQKNGVTVSGLSVGTHSIEFKAVAGWNKPTGKSVDVQTGKTASAKGSYGRVYTLNRDFDEGKLVGLEHKTVANQLQLSKSSTTLPFIWVPNSNMGTISKVDTKTGKELGRYRTGPKSKSTNPSRTTVDLQGNCWVGNRGTGTVVKVGLYENGQYEDRNGNGVIETSKDLNNDGVISDSETLDWGKDECVLLETVVIDGKVGSYKPGKYTGGYSSRPGPRGIAIDSKNNVWIGTFGNSKNKYYYVNGKTGQIIKTVDVSSKNHRAYGAVIDRNGNLWSSSLSNSLLKLNTANNSMKIIDVKHQTYGIALDKNDHLFVAGWGHNKLSRINTVTDKVEWTVETGRQTYPKGLTVDDNGDVWVAHYYEDAVVRWSNDGKKKATIKTGKQPSGVAIDAAGKPWSVNYSDQYLKRINPATNSVELEKLIKGNHYSYSDMTGIVARSMTTKIGTWTVAFNSKSQDTIWDTVKITAVTPKGTSVITQVRSSKNGKSWSSWEAVTKGAGLTKTPAGMYLEVETTMQITSGEVSSVLKDLTVQVK